MKTPILIFLLLTYIQCFSQNTDFVFHTARLQPGERYFLPVEDSLMEKGIDECDSRWIREYPFYMRFRGTKIEYCTCFIFAENNTSIYILKYRAHNNEKGEGIELISRKYLHKVKDFEKLTHSLNRPKP